MQTVFIYIVGLRAIFIVIQCQGGLEQVERHYKQYDEDF